MKYTVKTKCKWAEEMTNNELIKDVERNRTIGILFSVIGTLIIPCSLIHFMFGFLGLTMMIVGIEAHIRFRYCQIIKLIKNEKEDE